MIESIALSVCANWVYEFLKLSMPISPVNLIAYFGNNEFTLIEPYANKLIDVIENENLSLKAKQLSKDEFTKELERNKQFQKLVENVNYTVINNTDGSQLQISGNNRFVNSNITTNNNITNNIETQKPKKF